MRGAPAFFEARSVKLEKLAPGRIVDQHETLLPVEARNNHVVGRAAVLSQANNERAALQEVLLKIAPFSLENEAAKPRPLKIVSHAGAEDAFCFPRVERLLDQGSIRIALRYASAVPDPVLHDHGDRSGATAISFLLNEGNIQPDAGRLGYSRYTAEGHAKRTKRSEWRARHSSGYKDERYKEGRCQRDDDVSYLCIGQRAGGDIPLYFVGL